MPPKMIQAAPGATTTDGPGAVRSLARLLSCIRFNEVLVLQGSPLLGAVFSMGGLTMAKAMTLSVLAAANCCLVAHVFLFNDWCGICADLQDPNRVTGAFVTKGIRRAQIGHLSMALLALSLLLFSPFGSRTLITALAIAGLSTLYSSPAFNIKSIPLVNSGLHFVGGLLHFMLGYSLFSPVDVRGLEIATFFALIFMAGHLTNEVRDREGDLLNGISTNAVTFGKGRSFTAGLVLFTIADALLVVLAARATVPRALALTAVLYPLHFYWSFRAVRAGLTFESIQLFQARYRALYATIGVMMVSTVLTS
jgi:4-hydroxybenzoate polyprenyltransferase